MFGLLVDNKLRNIFNKGRFSPVTLETWKIGHNLSLTKLVAERMTSS